ncbi:MAG: DNA-directed RNA polymerase subunit alpha [Rickettsiales bacterium]|jgi:DNA-directed RNA polymerase subunit alpha|nr:DNA-directed RNA polymerase subunit alpha [Rickettsiales bacterium]
MAILQENWKDLIFPNSIKIEYKDKAKTSAMVVVEPLDKGYGITLGNSLRRVLLSSIRGFAVTSIKIDTVLHEYSVINGIREDVADIIINIKSLVLVKSTTNPSTLKLKLNKKGAVYARDIVLSDGVEILNSDLIICNIEDSNVNLNVEMVVECGKGYVRAEDKKLDNRDVTTIFLDSLFNPVKRVLYSVENVRVGDQTDYDRLMLEVETNGTISPEDVVSAAAKILQKQLEAFVTFKTKETAVKLVAGDVVGEENSLNTEFNKKIDEMELSVRAYNCLISENIKYVGDLIQKTEFDMLRLPNFGKKSLNELRENLKVLGLSFGMSVGNWKRPSSELSKKKKE